MISHLNIIQFYQIEVNGTLENKIKPPNGGIFYITAVIAFTEPKLYAVFYSLHKFSLRICPIQLILATISKSVISKRSANISLSDGIYLSP